MRHSGSAKKTFDVVMLSVVAPMKIFSNKSSLIYGTTILSITTLCISIMTLKITIKNARLSLMTISIMALDTA
jgi:hypothetical protein